jgi:hypothetical protein
MRHECATKFLLDFINIEKRYKRKNPANRWICRVYRSFLAFFEKFENFVFPLFSGLRGERGIRTPGPVTVNSFQDCRIRPLCHFSSMLLSFADCECKYKTLFWFSKLF